jgi:exopolysaccharide production protein ExoZ
MRGLAALGVVFCHYGSDLSAAFNFGQSGVYVFFLISGFIIVYSLIKSGYKPDQFFKFLFKRSIRIDPSYFVVILLTLILFKILSYIPSFKGNAIPFIPGQFVAHIFYVVPFTKYTFYNHVFWTLGVEFQFYLLIGLIYFLYDNSIYKIAFLISFCFSCLIPFSNSYYIVFSYAPLFALGISLVTFYQKRNRINIIMPIFFLIVIAVKFGVPVFILLLFTCIVILYFKLAIKPLAFLGEISYSLYLTHGITFIVFSGLLKRLSITLNPWMRLFIEIPVAIAFAYIFYLLIEKPSQHLSKRVFYKKPKGSSIQTHLSSA